MDASRQLEGMPPLKRPKNEAETLPDSEDDRISDLTEGVLEHLLSLMPAHDAVRTSLLARRWRHIWKTAPAILFTPLMGFESIDRFNQFVDRVLLLRRNGAPLESCDFVILENEVYSNHVRAVNEPRLVSWIYRALLCKVTVLRFRLGFDDPISLCEDPLVSRHLTKLELEHVLMDETVLDFSGCPMLIYLKMVRCFPIGQKMSSPSLQHLQMIDCRFSEDHLTQMSLPNLVSFKLDDSSGRTPFLESMPSLVTAIVKSGYDSSDRCIKGGSGDCGDDACEGCRNYYGSGDGRRHCVFLRGLTQASDLELSAHPDVFVFKRDLKWCSTFSKLKTLVLREWFVTDDLGALIWFLQHSPVLEKLTLQTSKVHKISGETAERYDPTEQSVASDHLELVEIKCREVDEMVVAILKILYLSGIPLEKIQIHKYSSFGCLKLVYTDFCPNEDSSNLWLCR